MKKNSSLKIGFFGDSFCDQIVNPHSVFYKYDTYIKLLKQNYNAEVVNLGKGGSSIWDVVLNQFPLHKDNLPDVMIFVWTDFNRIYHKTVRNMTYTYCCAPVPWAEMTIQRILNPAVIKSGKAYFDHLFDFEKAELEYLSLLYYFDNEILSKINTKTKIVHLWSFEKRYDWKNGVEIKTPLVNFAEQQWAQEHIPHWVPNHISGEQNIQVFDLIKKCIDD